MNKKETITHTNLVLFSAMTFFRLLFIASLLIHAGRIYSAELTDDDDDYLDGVRSSTLTGRKEILKSESIEFGNQNTFVRYLDEKQNFWGKNVTILAQSKMVSNHWMELLQKIFALKTHGMKKINIHFEIIGENSDLFCVEKQNHECLFFSKKQIENIAGSAGATHFNGEMISFSRVRDLAKRPFLFNKNREFLITGSTHFELAKKISRLTNIPYEENPHYLELPPKYLILVSSPGLSLQKLDNNVNDNIFQLFSEIFKIKEAGHFLHLLSGYYPYARSDKASDQKNGERVGVYATLMAKIFEDIGVDAMVWVKAHAGQTQGFFHQIPTHEMNLRKTVTDYLRQLEVDLVVAPDAGAQKDDTQYSDILHIPIVVANKHRDPKTYESKIVGFDCADVKGKKVAIIDDETASGGTLSEMASYLHNHCQAGKIYAVVTHLAGPGKSAIENIHIEKLVVTDSLPFRLEGKILEKIEVLSVATEIADYFKSLLFEKIGDI